MIKEQRLSINKQIHKCNLTTILSEATEGRKVHLGLWPQGMIPCGRDVTVAGAWSS